MIQKPKGTKDILPSEVYKWQYVEEKIKRLLENCGMKEIRVPVFEHTELFSRGVGETTDVVQKEMYTFEDKGGRSITLRPEGTAGVVRSYIENGMASMPGPLKFWYEMPMYRYENVQKGRLREFRQIGTEIIGTSSYLADVEAILLGINIFKVLDIPNIKLNINSIGCPSCRAKYQEALRDFIRPNLDLYCDTCKTRFEKNPMRILDCKEKKCKEMNQGAPVILDYLCDECKEHFENVKRLLDNMNVAYEIDSGIVRGLDYYTRTVFEFISEDDGLTVLGGGRYDGLVKEIGGVDTPAVGFAMGVERLLEVFDRYNADALEEKSLDIYIANIGDEANLYATKLVEELRENGTFAEKDICERSLKAQFKYADKMKAKFVITLGDDEVQNGKAKMKNMKTGEEVLVQLNVNDIIEKI
ncbi:MAG: histidine--tRNA ligase [Clostridia bacterium]|jgi:histidyl-tRNA synthetase|nr:histidine--tRNA ligase [Clostridia bacterium]